MKILIGYATNEGQTRIIARRVMDTLSDQGHSIELVCLSDIDHIDLDRFDAVVLAASVHAGHYQTALTEFAAENANGLQLKPTLFLSVSLAAAGHDAEDWKGLEKVLEELKEASGWTPGVVEQVAGAYRPSQYDIFHRFIMRRIIAMKDPEADLDEDREYTDWSALMRALEGWMATVETRISPE